MEITENRIIFLSVPESLRGRFEPEEAIHHEHGHDGHDHYEEHHNHEARSGFTIDPAIPLPVEIPPGDAAAAVEQLSWEMILSGMLRVIRSWELKTDSLAAGIAAEDIDYYRRFVLAVRPGILEEFTEAAILEARNHSFGTALEILSALRGLFPRSPLPLLNCALVTESRAGALEQAGREDEAEAEYEKVHEMYRTLLAETEPLPGALFNAGFFYMKRRNFTRARACFSAYLPRAADEEKKERAAAIVREIGAQNLDDEIFREAYDFIRMGEEEKGLARIRDFLERHSAVWNGWFLLGWGLRRQGRWGDGEAAFRKAVELGGGSSDTRNELAICLMEQGNYAAARAELEHALREEPENVKIISNLGVLALKMGNGKEAGGFFRTVLEIEPDDTIARQYLEEASKTG
ncbi:MAG: tetratricopeptide repeat protein [Spirochaetaceae bacterium]|jgi:tetratricopeptide (TPR) repeat protein|nr:tetratricopeptide repeat protein [Spirochaetaceae bacterium]